MKPFLRLFSALLLLCLLTTCGKEKEAITSANLGRKIIKRIETQVELSPEQEAQIMKMTANSDIMASGVRTSEDKAKYELIRAKIAAEVLTAEQRAIVQPN